MPFGEPCQPGCTCGKHKGRTFVSRQASQADYYAENREQKIAASQAWAKANPGRRRALVRKSSQRYVEKNRSAINAKARARRDPAKDSLRARNQKYGEQWAQKFEEQHGLCYLCGEPLDFGNPRKIHVDHDHSCCRGQRTCGNCIRGLACEPCNKGIGLFGDDPDRMERAAARLRAANADVAARKAAAPVQTELPLNVTPLRRDTG